MSRQGNSGGVVKNRAPAPIQISAEQILREAADRQEQHVVEPVVKVHDAEEYQSYLRDRRKHFEDNIRYRREHIGNWVKYARLEEDHKEFERARSIMERALEVDPRSAELWLRYAELELRNEFINHARNVLDRAVQLLPRVDFLWYKYVWMEEMMNDIPKCRAVFERWMKWMPDDNAWLSYARFETRVAKSLAAGAGEGEKGAENKQQPSSNGTKAHNNRVLLALDRAEAIMRRYVNTYPTAVAFMKFAKWAEWEAQQVDLARTIWEATLTELEPEESKQAKVFRQFASFEERQGEYDRVRVIYRHAVKLLHLGNLQDPSMDMEEDEKDDYSTYERKKRIELYQAYVAFEKKHGNKEGIEDVLITKQRREYRQRVAADPYDYDAWFEWARMEQDHTSSSNSNGVELVRQVFEQAVAQVPPTPLRGEPRKDSWRRYIYLWIYYAVYEELDNLDLDRASQVYDACLSVIPHASFTFAKVWIQAAKLHVRRRALQAARKLLGKAIGVCGKEIIFQEYIALELALGEIDRCRALYTNYVKAMPYNCAAWSNFAALEQSVGETERCRSLYELAVSQSVLDRPEVLWKAFIDFEVTEGQGENARKLYQRLLDRTSHVKVWISLAQFEATPILGKGIEHSRATLQKAYDHLKEEGLSEERVLLLDSWRVLEQQEGNAASVAAVEQKLPRRIKRKRMRKDDDGNDIGWEEYFDYQFPDDSSAASSNLKILELAAKWKRQQEQTGDESDDDDDDDDDDMEE
jgi:crooked neck